MTIEVPLLTSNSVAQARTGTGKTLGFLLPTIQNILRANPELAHRQRYSRARPSDIRAIIISPTRELAEQIAVEADKLCYATDLRVQVAVGGSNKRMMLNKMQREGCHLLVATPGRLNDLLTDPYSGVRADKTTTLVLDEADRLLDDGFSTEIEAIIDLLPNRDHVDRQTLLFSATMPREVMHLVRRTLKPNFHFFKHMKRYRRKWLKCLQWKISTLHSWSFSSGRSKSLHEKLQLASLRNHSKRLSISVPQSKWSSHMRFSRISRLKARVSSESTSWILLKYLACTVN
jgi:superfamily II DNA/RNA helicase